ncbi:hypothetical protein [Noviherbaspirillum suwonense]|uniref:NACHT domain-containing protein n=1 Tax=Noviherbaspirillum suwonense TaxID=1224511 RepID=A0ABY1QX38_9BURK|nr:hypothetical protein [Noviherbaspirillum suwonense]SMP81208.1 hypothetical protein SAMN06295970_14211 [Noviherbaspirillum suwonense]
MSSTIASGPRSIAVGGSVIASVLITGDRAKVFRGEYVDIAQFYIDPQPIFDRVHLDRYVPRQQIEDAVDAFFSESDRGYFILEAKGGLGKTTMAAHLVKSRSYLHHFVETFPGSEGELAGVRNIAAQLALVWKLLDDSENYVPLGSLGPDVLQSLIGRAAARRDELLPKEKIVIVIDALDEASHPASRNVFGLPRNLPRGVYVICTKRPQEVSLNITGARRIFSIKADAPDNIEDLRTYLIGRAISLQLAPKLENNAIPTHSFVNTLLSKSEGIWVYVDFVLREIENDARLPNDIENLPSGLRRYFADFFGSWAQRNSLAWEKYGRRVLVTLAVVQDDVSLALACRFMGIEDSSDLRRTLQQDWSPFITRKAGREVAFSLYHGSIRDFVLGRFSASEDLMEQEEAFAGELSDEASQMSGHIATCCLTNWGGLDSALPRLRDKPGEEIARYGAKHLPYHLAEAGRAKELHELLLLSSEANNLWYEFKSSQNDLDQYISQLSFARSIAVNDMASDDVISTDAIATSVRYGLTRSSLNTIASNLPWKCIAFAIDSKAWTLERAISHAEQCEDGESRARAYFPLIQRASERIRLQCIRAMITAISHVSGNPKSHFESTLWIDILSEKDVDWNEGELELCFNAITGIEGSEDCLSALAQLCRLSIRPNLAREIMSFAATASGSGGESLAAAFADYRTLRSRVEVRLLAIRALPMREKAKEYSDLLDQLELYEGSHLLAIALRMVRQDEDYDSLERNSLLPDIEPLVEKCYELCVNNDFLGKFAAEELLIVAGDKKRKLFESMVLPSLFKDGGGDRASRIARIARENPEFESELVQLSGDLWGFSAAKVLGSMLSFSLLARRQLLGMDYLSNSLLDGMIEQDSLGDFISILPDDKIDELIDAVDKFSDQYTRARGLSQISLKLPRESRDVVLACIQVVEQLDDSHKIDRILGALSSHHSLDIVELAFNAARRGRDESDCIWALTQLLPHLEGADRVGCIKTAAAMLGKVRPYYSRAGLLCKFAAAVIRVLSTEEESILQAAYSNIPTTNAAYEVAWLLTLVKTGAIERRAIRIEEALRVARDVPGWPRVGLISDIFPYCEFKSQSALAAELATELQLLDSSDQKYAFPKAAQFLEGDFRSRMCMEIVRETPDDKLYSLDVLCTVLDRRSTFELRERAISTEEDQLLPHLVIALARLECFEDAFELQPTISEGRRVDALLGMVKFLNASHFDTAIELAKAVRGNDYFEQQRDKVLAAIVERMHELRQSTDALKLTDAITSPTLRVGSRVRLIEALGQETVATILNEAKTVCLAAPEFYDRADINYEILKLSPTQFSNDELAALFAANLALTESESRSACYQTIGLFVPKLSQRLSSTVAAKVFGEMTRVNAWWP